MKERFARHIRYLFDFLLHIIPVNNKQVMFLSFEGQYNDNPKYISEKLHEMNPDVRIVWVISNRCHEIDQLPQYIKTVKNNTIRAEYEKNRSKVLIDNGVGWHVMKTSNKYLRKHIKRNDQLNISTHHGTILKKGGTDYNDGYIFKQDECVTTSDFLVTGNYYNADRLRSCYFYELPILMTGMPRNDILFRKDIDDSIIRKKLKLPEEYNLVLYAPSYRKNVEDAGLKQMNMINVDKLLYAFGNKFGGKWKLVFRAHNLVLENLDKSYFLSGSVYDGNIGDDMAEYLKVCDALISDFSGCLFDVALTDKPCFFFAHDVDNYINNERGVYFDLNKLPYSVSKNFEELLSNIELFNLPNVREKRIVLLNTLGNIEEGAASSKVVSIMMDFMKGNTTKSDILKQNANILFVDYKGGLL